MSVPKRSQPSVRETTASWQATCRNWHSVTNDIDTSSSCRRSFPEMNEGSNSSGMVSRFGQSTSELMIERTLGMSAKFS